MSYEEKPPIDVTCQKAVRDLVDYEPKFEVEFSVLSEYINLISLKDSYAIHFRFKDEY